jgi:hypothetical protein
LPPEPEEVGVPGFVVGSSEQPVVNAASDKLETSASERGREKRDRFIGASPARGASLEA